MMRRLIRVLVAAVVLLSVSVGFGDGAEPAEAAGVNEYSSPEWLPVRASSQIGCTYLSTNGICAPGYHTWWAIDLINASNVNVYAAGSGRAYLFTDATTCHGAGAANPDGSGGYGRHVLVDHGNGRWSRYAHLASFGVASGAWVDEDTVLGTMGNSGHSSCGSFHLHYEERTGVSVSLEGGTAVLTNGGSSVDPGVARACGAGGVVLSYPDAAVPGVGPSSWQGFPAHQYSASSSGTGCAVVDSDGDGVPDNVDLCPGTSPGVPVDTDGCEVFPEQIVVLSSNGTLSVKTGPLNRVWSALAGRVLMGRWLMFCDGWDRIAAWSGVWSVAGQELPWDSSWLTLTNVGAANGFELDGDRIAVLSSNGTLSVKTGPLNRVWSGVGWSGCGWDGG